MSKDGSKQLKSNADSTVSRVAPKMGAEEPALAELWSDVEESKDELSRIGVADSRCAKLRKDMEGPEMERSEADGDSSKLAPQGDIATPGFVKALAADEDPR